MQAYLTIAVRTTRKVAEFIVRESEKLRAEQSTSQNEFVSKVIQAAESIIIDTLTTSYKDHSFIGQESGQIGQSDYQWVINPIDGVNNFIRQIPQWSISIALKLKGRTVVSVVYDPLREELFTAVQGQGAQLNGKRIRVSNTTTLENCLLSTGFPYRNKNKLSDYLSIFSKLYPLCADMRRNGSASLDLAYLAAGRFDGFWETGLQEWNTEAGSLLVKEAGGMISDLKGNPNYLEDNSILAANPKIFKTILQTINTKD